MSQYTVNLHLTRQRCQMSVYPLCYCLQSLLLLLRKNQIFSSPKTSQQSVRKPNRPLLLYNSPCLGVYQPEFTLQYSTVQYSTNINYAVRFQSIKCIGRFCILNFTQFSQTSLLTMKYCSVKDCKCTSSCENGIAHDIGIVDFNSYMKNKLSIQIFSEITTLIYRLTFGSEVHDLFNQ